MSMSRTTLYQLNSFQFQPPMAVLYSTHDYAPGADSVLEGIMPTEQSKRVEKRKQHQYINQLTTQAIKDGKLVRPDHCSACGIKSDKPIHAHHEDYSKPYDVMWLCYKCHPTRHQTIRNEEYYFRAKHTYLVTDASGKLTIM